MHVLQSSPRIRRADSSSAPASVFEETRTVIISLLCTVAVARPNPYHSALAYGFTALGFSLISCGAKNAGNALVGTCSWEQAVMKSGQDFSEDASLMFRTGLAAGLAAVAFKKFSLLGTQGKLGKLHYRPLRGLLASGLTEGAIDSGHEILYGGVRGSTRNKASFALKNTLMGAGMSLLGFKTASLFRNFHSPATPAIIAISSVACGAVGGTTSEILLYERELSAENFWGAIRRGAVSAALGGVLCRRFGSGKLSESDAPMLEYNLATIPISSHQGTPRFFGPRLIRPSHRCLVPDLNFIGATNNGMGTLELRVLCIDKVRSPKPTAVEKIGALVKRTTLERVSRYSVFRKLVGMKTDRPKVNRELSVQVKTSAKTSTDVPIDTNVALIPGSIVEIKNGDRPVKFKVPRPIEASFVRIGGAPPVFAARRNFLRRLDSLETGKSTSFGSRHIPRAIRAKVPADFRLEAHRKDDGQIAYTVNGEELELRHSKPEQRASEAIFGGGNELVCGPGTKVWLFAGDSNSTKKIALFRWISPAYVRS